LGLGPWHRVPAGLTQRHDRRHRQRSRPGLQPPRFELDAVADKRINYGTEGQRFESCRARYTKHLDDSRYSRWDADEHTMWVRGVGLDETLGLETAPSP
jgi:hypothetical protein